MDAINEAKEALDNARDSEPPQDLQYLALAIEKLIEELTIANMRIAELELREAAALKYLKSTSRKR